ncbi:MAG: carboxylating nicotinate-nucleotide diphosphorylase [Prolixibacteraceae bacterium]|jgi:nicotinate-nucleotide pyrophosphorylase (carboxylating)|nr:carboxylating nicotinate-nucleotide diphosphorylase [Prolixibacteraceae bacterium]HNQ36798.1 carboxylating nicotinate-nucleotide diphosphorylase [Prolixibacteraceae bacterium]
MNMNQKELEAAGVLVALALEEDVAAGDLTTNHLVPAGMTRRAVMKAKADGVVAGLEVAEMVFRRFDPALEWTPRVRDGEQVSRGEVIVAFRAGYRALLTGERTALNFLQRLSGIATVTRDYVTLLEGYPTRILDTRKTLPGFRLLDKYAVRAGGAVNHRIGLYDMVMIKDNHIRVAGGIGPAVAAIRGALGPEMTIEVETSCLREVEEALAAGADIIMLDNMDNETMRRAVMKIAGKARTEASGNMSPERLAEVAKTGVDFISVGALTHSVRALDISQEILEAE